MSSLPPIPPGHIPFASSGLPEADPQARTYAMLCHLASLSGYVTGLGFILGPLIVWAIKKDQYAFVDRHGKEAINFNLSMMIYGIVAAVLILAFVGIILLPIITIVWLVMTIIAAIKANSGEEYRYPLTIRFF